VYSANNFAEMSFDKGKSRTSVFFIYDLGRAEHTKSIEEKLKLKYWF
jgi:hypothetical protein